MATSAAKKPANVLNKILSVDVKRNGSESEFVRLSPGVYGLRASHGAGTGSGIKTADESSNALATSETDVGENKRRVRIPLFPTYREVRHLLKALPGRPKAHITGLHRALAQLLGTPQNPVDWTNPDAWIPEKLSGESRELAIAIWTLSEKTVNPRHTTGHWLLSQKYGLVVQGSGGDLVMTDRGHDFMQRERGESEMFLDEQEGLVEILSIVADSGPARLAAFVEVWAEYLKRHSRFGTDSTIRDTPRRRLNNLLDRELISRERAKYEVTDIGQAYLKRVAPSHEGDELHNIRKLAKKREVSVRAGILEHLLQMEPDAFEHLVGRVLEALDYQNVKVVGRSGDGGVDVVADIELGVTSVREVVQAKRHKRTIQRKDLDALRGSLYRFDAVRGTIVATSSFTSGTKEAAFARGAAPITLIDGDNLIDLLIEHGIGVRKRMIEVLTVDLDALMDVEDLGEE